MTRERAARRCVTASARARTRTRARPPAARRGAGPAVDGGVFSKREENGRDHRAAAPVRAPPRRGARLGTGVAAREGRRGRGVSGRGRGAARRLSSQSTLRERFFGHSSVEGGVARLDYRSPFAYAANSSTARPLCVRTTRGRDALSSSSPFLSFPRALHASGAFSIINGAAASNPSAAP